MKTNNLRSRALLKIRRKCTAVLCAALLVPGGSLLLAQSQQPAQSQQAAPSQQKEDSAEKQAAKIPPDQLDSLVAPIALYPDPLLAQTLAASTYPLEIIQLQQWLTKNPKLKDKELAEAVAKQPWDPSVQAMAGLPEVVKRLADDIQWTTDLGNAFLAQQSDVMEAVQRMRKKAQAKGNLNSAEQRKVQERVQGSGRGRGRGSWEAEREHRGGAAYRDRGTANRDGGAGRGESAANRQAGARQQASQQGGKSASNQAAAREANAGERSANREAAAGNTSAARDAAASNRAAGGAGAGDRAAAARESGAGNRAASSGSQNAFGGGSSGSKRDDGSTAPRARTRGSATI